MPNNIRKQTMFLPNGGSPEQVDLSTLPQPGQLGGKITIINPPNSAYPGRSKTYQLVKTDSTMSVTPYDGAVAWWSDQANYVVTTAASSRGRIAGVFVNAPTKGNYTCIQTDGRHDDVKFVDAPTATPTTAGLFVIPSATAGKADCLAAGTAATYPTLGISAGTYDAAAATAAVDLNVPETT